MTKRVLNPDQFDLRDESNDTVHTIAAFHPNFGQGQMPVGFMIWDRQSGRISNIDVDAGHRRQGIGKRMYQAGMQFQTPPKHDVVKNRTTLGKKWVQGVGGPSIG